MFRFAQPEFLNLLFLIPLLAAGVWWLFVLKRKNVRRFGNHGTVERLIDQHSRYKFFVKWGMILSALALLLVAFARPQIGTKFEEVTRQGVDLIVALDVSNSMLAEDIQPSRLESAKRELLQLINSLRGDRIGVIVFAGDAYTQLPLTTDYNAAMLLSEIIDVNLVPKQGTAIGSAIELAQKSFAKDEGKYKAIIVITDGENHEDDALSAAKEAAKNNIIIHTIGMGSRDGAPIPVRVDGQSSGFRKDREGNTIVTKLDEATLQEVAVATGGKYVRATTGSNELDVLFKEIEKMEKKEFGTKQFTDYEDRFQYFVFAAMLLLAVETLTSEKRNRFLTRFALFNAEKNKEKVS